MDYISFATLEHGSSLAWHIHTVRYNWRVRIGVEKLLPFDYFIYRLVRTSDYIMIIARISTSKIIFLVFFRKEIAVDLNYSSQRRYEKILLREV